MFDLNLFASRLKEQRLKHHMTQEDVGRLLGITTTQAGDMERGKTATSMPRFYLLCEHFNLSADYLIGLTDDPKPLRENGPDSNEADFRSN